MVRPLLAELYCSRDTGRDDGHFVDPVDQLKETVDIQEPTNRESREELHLDHDIQGMTGSPELARAILNKIDASQVVVADVTLVGRRPDADAADTTIPRDGLINSARKRLGSKSFAFGVIVRPPLIHVRLAWR